MDMDAQLTAVTAVNTNTNYAALFKSARGKLHPSYRSVPEGHDPEDFAADLANAYKLHTSQFKHIFYRVVLFKEPVVSIAKLSKITNSGLSAMVEGHFFIQEEIYDPMLTAAMRNPTILRNVDPDSFYAVYKDIMVEADDPAPRAAILIHLENDPVAAKIFRIASSVVSIAVGLIGTFAF